MILKPGNPWGRLRGKLSLNPTQALRMFGFVMNPEALGVIFRQYVWFDDNNHPHTGTFISNYFPASNPQTDKQQLWRERFRKTVIHWHQITQKARDNWNRLAREKRLAMSGFNLHNREILLRAGD